MSDTRKRIGILYGGKSVEHQISINSAKNIFQFIDKSHFEPFLIGISREGNWYLCDDVSAPMNMGKPISIDFSAEKASLSTSDGVVHLDIAFPVLHGTNGEDGSIQGLLQVMNLPFVGTGVLGSSICMSKLVSKQLMEFHEIPTSKFLSYTKDQLAQIDFSTVSSELGLPIMVKAANLGSSVGINKVSRESEFQGALEDSFRYDNVVLIEEFIEASEIECAVMGNEVPMVSNPGEIKIEGDYDFYTFDAKYVDGNAVSIEIPAKMDVASLSKVKEACRKAYQVLKCEDFARVDLFLKDNGEFFLNEINTIPGFTDSSMFPMMWKDAGISFSELITKLINFAEVRNDKQREVETTFSSKLD